MRKTILWVLIILVVGGGLYAAFNGGNPGNTDPEGGKDDPRPATVPAISVSPVGGPLVHDTAAFTEGLLFYKGQLWESTGLEGQSYIQTVDLSSGSTEKKFTLEPDLFGEGIVILRDTLYQLTWRNHKAFAYDLKTMKRVKEYTYGPEGWGMTTDGKVLIASDGTSNLYFYEPGTLRELHRETVSINGMPTGDINELEWINGFIYANVWRQNTILKIDPANGNVVGSMDLSSLMERARAKNPAADVLNGIAYNPETKKVYVTGKNWPEMYEIQFAF